MKKILFIILLSTYVNSIYAANPQTKSTFIVQAGIEKGCSLDNRDQNIEFGKHSALSQAKFISSIVNSKSTWNIKCTENMPVNIMINEGDNFDSSNVRRMKHNNSPEYVKYRLYTSSSLDSEYLAGNVYPLVPVNSTNSILDFSIYGVADLENNNQSRSAGTYKDSVSILISW